MRFLVLFLMGWCSLAKADEPLLKVQLSEYHPLATKSHLLERLLPKQYHKRFIQDKNWQADQLDEFRWI